jgi:hypothetical protein
MPPFGILRRVALVRTDVSEEYIAFITKETRICALGAMLAVTSNLNHAAKKYYDSFAVCSVAS